VLADANGFSDPGQPLTAGVQLKAPSVRVSSNDAGTFKPYNPGEAIGSTSPGLPYIEPPPKQHCNTLAMVIMIVVAVVVTVFTAGAALTAIAGAGATFATAGVGAAMAAGFVGGAVGSIASQAIGSAMGVASFSWKQVAVDGITNAVTAGATSWLSGAGKAANTASKFYTVADDGTRALTTLGRAAQGAISYGGSIVANAAVGRDTNFSWNAVAASVVGSYASAKTGGRLPVTQGGTSSGNFISDFGGLLVNGAVNATARRAMGLGKQDWGQIAIDAFGNALGNAAVGKIQSWQANRAADRNAVRSGMPSLFDPGYQPDWLYGDEVGSPHATGGVDTSMSSVSASFTAITGNGDVHPSNAGGMSREQRIARVNEWYDSQPGGGGTPIDNTISDEGLKGLEAGLDGSYDPTATNLATVEVHGVRPESLSSFSWRNGYGAGPIFSGAFRMKGTSDMVRAPQVMPQWLFDKMSRENSPIPRAWIEPNSPSQESQGVGALDIAGSTVSVIDSVAVVTEKVGGVTAAAKVSRITGPYSVISEGTQLAIESVTTEQIDKGNAGHFGVTAGSYAFVAFNPELWPAAVVYGLADAALQLNEYEVKYSHDSYHAGDIVTGWESEFIAPQSDRREAAIRSLLNAQSNMSRTEAERQVIEAARQAQRIGIMKRGW
jgi:hypothetical protein